MTSKEAQCAKAIRAELKTAFPGHTFRVRVMRGYGRHYKGVEVYVHHASESIQSQIEAVLVKYRDRPNTANAYKHVPRVTFVDLNLFDD